jgi:hypothetical protein
MQSGVIAFACQWAIVEREGRTSCALAERLGDGGEISLSLRHASNLVWRVLGTFGCPGVGPSAGVERSIGRPYGAMF